jgi:hypothetical protein
VYASFAISVNSLFTFPASSGGGNLEQTLTLGNTASLGFQLYEGSLIDLNDNL